VDINRRLLGEAAARTGLDKGKWEDLLAALSLRIDSKAAQRFLIAARTHTPVAVTMVVHTFLYRAKVGDIPKTWTPKMRVKAFMSDVLREDRDIVEMGEDGLTRRDTEAPSIPQAEVNAINEEADYELRRWDWKEI